MNVEPISEEKSAGCGSTVLAVVFGGVFFLAGIGILWAMAIGPLVRTQGSSNWIETQCKVTKSKLDIDSSGDGTTYRPDIEFEYTIGENSFESGKYDFTALSRTKKRCKEIVSAYPVGKQTICFFDPDDHKTAVIIRDYDFSWFALLFPMVFVVIGFAIMVGSLFYKKGSSTKSMPGSVDAAATTSKSGLAPSNFASSSSSSSMAPSAPPHPADIEDNNWDCPRTLKPTRKRLTTFLMALFTTIFCGGIVSLIASEMFADGIGKGEDLFPQLFIIPFVLVSLGMVGWVIYSFAAMFNPTVELALSSGAVNRGESFDVAWQMSGRTSYIKSLKVTVEGEESATYRRGTDTITDKNIFCSIPVAEVLQSQDMEFGSESVTMPADTMHTFKADRNRITWRITVKGYIPYWPNIKETYEFRVKP